jgi:hypothetical protein
MKRHRIGRVVLPLLLVLSFAALFILFTKKEEDPGLSNEATLRDVPEADYDQFKAEKVFITEQQGARTLFTLYADSIIHRKRRAKFFVYQNLKEIHLKNAKIDIYPESNPSSTNRKQALPFDLFKSSFESFGNTPASVQDYLAGNSDLNLDLLSRVLLDELSIDIHLPGSKRFSLCAERARINVDFENIVLEGEVRIVAADGMELRAPQAVWSRKLDGIYLPGRHVLQNRSRDERAFFAMTPEGGLARLAKTPDIDYADLLEEKEKIFYSNISEKMPAYSRVMFGMMDNR